MPMTEAHLRNRLSGQMTPRTILAPALCLCTSREVKLLELSYSCRIKGMCRIKQNEIEFLPLQWNRVGD